MQNRKTLLIILIAVILLAGFSVFTFKNQIWQIWYGVTNDDEVASDNYYDNEIIAIAREYAVKRQYYVGDLSNGYLAKGKLLDESSETLYEQLPDSLYSLDYGDFLFCTNCNGEVDQGSDYYSYSLYDNKEYAKKELSDEYRDRDKEHILKYLVLADEGKVEYPKYKYKYSTLNDIVDEETYDTAYQMFDNVYLAEIPNRAKEKISEFLQTEEGSSYKFDNRQLDIRKMISINQFTGKEQPDVAIILTYSNESGTDVRFKLMVYAYSTYSHNYYILYNETFYDTLTIQSLYYSSEGEDFEPHIYMESEEKQQAPYPPLMIKQQGRLDVALVYNNEFDKMVQYPQMALSANEIEDDEYEGEY